MPIMWAVRHIWQYKPWENKNLVFKLVNGMLEVLRNPKTWSDSYGPGEAGWSYYKALSDFHPQLIDFLSVIYCHVTK